MTRQYDEIESRLLCQYGRAAATKVPQLTRRLKLFRAHFPTWPLAVTDPIIVAASPADARAVLLSANYPRVLVCALHVRVLDTDVVLQLHAGRRLPTGCWLKDTFPLRTLCAAPPAIYRAIVVHRGLLIDQPGFSPFWTFSHATDAAAGRVVI